MNITYRGERHTRGETGRTRILTYTGTQQELKSYLDSLSIGNNTSEGEYISSASLSQKDGPVWQLEITWSDSCDGSGPSDRAPSTAYGKKSAKLDCSCFSVPLETLPLYRKKWDHYLLVGKSIFTATNGTVSETIPAWWDTAGNDFIMTPEDMEKYRWVKDPALCPVGIDQNDMQWRILKNPTKPGIHSVDQAAYRIVESVRCRTARDAGSYAANNINCIVSPDERFGIKKNRGFWKCDAVSIVWNGKDWIATMTYTMSNKQNGWDTDLYSEE